VTYRSIARQRFGKQVPAEVNAVNNRKSIARQRISKHAFLTIEAVFLRGPPKVIIKKGSAEKSQLLSEDEKVNLRVVVENCVEFWSWQ
jgi:hypothetical protein